MILDTVGLPKTVCAPSMARADPGRLGVTEEAEKGSETKTHTKDGCAFHFKSKNICIS